MALDRFGRLDGAANCIGSVLLKPAHLTSDTEWHDTITTNLTSSFYLVRAASKAMRQSGGSIVLVSSAAARIGLANHEAIAAAKAGIIGLTLSAAATYAGRGIRVNAVAPGLVKSEMTRKLWETESAAAVSSQMHALGRLGEPEDIAKAIAWLLDPENNWITGQSIGVDGGLSSLLPRMKV
jgi:NAD(P)-dependent dehydrogenase (short-subunit alcohol dehydrogenase family)